MRDPRAGVLYDPMGGVLYDPMAAAAQELQQKILQQQQMPWMDPRLLGTQQPTAQPQGLGMAPQARPAAMAPEAPQAPAARMAPEAPHPAATAVSQAPASAFGQLLGGLGLAPPRATAGGLFGSPAQAMPEDLSDISPLQELALRFRNAEHMGADRAGLMPSQQLRKDRQTGNERRVKAINDAVKLMQDFDAIRNKARPEDFDRIDGLLKKRFVELAGGAPGDAESIYDTFMTGTEGLSARLLEMAQDDPEAQQILAAGGGVGDLVKLYGSPERVKRALDETDDAAIPTIRTALQSVLESTDPEVRAQLESLRDPESKRWTLDSLRQIAPDALTNAEWAIAKRNEDDLPGGGLSGLELSKEVQEARKAGRMSRLRREEAAARIAARAPTGGAGDAAYARAWEEWRQNGGTGPIPEAGPDVSEKAVTNAARLNAPFRRELRIAKEGGPEAADFSNQSALWRYGGFEGPPPVPGPGVPEKVVRANAALNERARKEQRAAAATGGAGDAAFAGAILAWLESGMDGPMPVPGPDVSRREITEASRLVLAAQRNKRLGKPSATRQEMWSTQTLKQRTEYRDTEADLERDLALPYDGTSSYQILNGWIHRLDNTAARTEEVQTVRAEATALAARIRGLFQKYTKGSVIPIETFNEIKTRMREQLVQAKRLHRQYLSDRVTTGGHLFGPENMDWMVPGWREALGRPAAPPAPAGAPGAASAPASAPAPTAAEPTAEATPPAGHPNARRRPHETLGYIWVEPEDPNDPKSKLRRVK